jgi:mannosyl-3-phosphoglycerate phosphatase
LAEIGRILHGEVRGFGSMRVAEIAELTGLDPAAVRRARQREFDEPFVFTADPRAQADALRRVLVRRGLAITRGGRFYHLHGRTDKGRAMQAVLRWLPRSGKGGARWRTIALGDSAHDLAFLREAALPILIPRPDGSVDPALRRGLPGAMRAPAPGPRGWAAALRRLVL